MTNGEKLEQVFPDGICPFSKNWLDYEYKKPTTKNDLGVSSGLEKNSQKLENPTKKYCGCCKHWKRKGVKKIGDKPTSYGKCTKLSISGFEVETTYNDDCSSEGLE